jgi:hypothetical protein
VERANFAYLLLGVAAAAENGTRSALSIGARTVEMATRPAALVWRSPVAAPVRGPASDLATSLERDGRELAERTSTRARQAIDPLADQVIDRLLSTGALDRVIVAAINHPGTDELLANTLDEPGLERLVARVMESRLVDDVVDQLLASDEMRRILDYVTRSPELRAALTHQTAGIAEDVAVGMRSRTAVGDVKVERFARSLVRRGRQPKDE